MFLPIAGGVELDAFWRSLPTQTIPWFYDNNPVLQNWLLDLPCSQGHFVVFMCVVSRLLAFCNHVLNTHCLTWALRALGQSNHQLPTAAALTYSPCSQNSAQSISQHDFFMCSVATAMKTHQVFFKPWSLLNTLLDQSEMFNKSQCEVTRRSTCFQGYCRLLALKECQYLHLIIPPVFCHGV